MFRERFRIEREGRRKLAFVRTYLKRLKNLQSLCYEIDRRSLNNRKKEKLQTDEDSMCSFESRWKHKKEMQAGTVVSVFFCSHSKEVRPLEDDEVDRAEVEVWHHMELTVTNRSRA